MDLIGSSVGPEGNKETGGNPNVPRSQGWASCTFETLKDSFQLQQNPQLTVLRQPPHSVTAQALLSCLRTSEKKKEDAAGERNSSLIPLF